MDKNKNKFNYYEWINFFSQGYDIYSLNNQLKGKNANNDLCNYPEQLKIISKFTEKNETKEDDKNSNNSGEYIKTESNEVSLNGKLPIKTSKKDNDLNELRKK